VAADRPACHDDPEPDCRLPVCMPVPVHSRAQDMEYHVRDMILSHLPDGWDSLGVHAEFDHTAATLLGEEVVVSSTITAVDRKLVKAETIISDRLGELGRGVHHRVVADMSRNQTTLAKRAASLAALPQPQPLAFVDGPPSRHGARTPADYLEDLSARTAAMAFEKTPPNFDGYCSGDWVQSFEQEVAALMGKPRGLFVVTGTQAQQCAIQAHAEGGEVPKLFAAHPTSHLLLSEEDACAAHLAPSHIPASSARILSLPLPLPLPLCLCMCLCLWLMVDINRWVVD
jgi:predicted thioesterase